MNYIMTPYTTRLWSNNIRCWWISWWLIRLHLHCTGISMLPYDDRDSSSWRRCAGCDGDSRGGTSARRAVRPGSPRKCTQQHTICMSSSFGEKCWVQLKGTTRVHKDTMCRLMAPVLCPAFSVQVCMWQQACDWSGFYTVCDCFVLANDWFNTLMVCYIERKLFKSLDNFSPRF